MEHLCDAHSVVVPHDDGAVISTSYNAIAIIQTYIANRSGMISNTLTDLLTYICMSMYEYV